MRRLRRLVLVLSTTALLSLAMASVAAAASPAFQINQGAPNYNGLCLSASNWPGSQHSPTAAENFATFGGDVGSCYP